MNSTEVVEAAQRYAVRPVCPSPATLEAAVREAGLASVRAAQAPANAPCGRCAGLVGINSCSCKDPCGHRDCFADPVARYGDMPGMVHAAHPIPTFEEMIT